MVSDAGTRTPPTPARLSRPVLPGRATFAPQSSLPLPFPQKGMVSPEVP